MSAYDLLANQPIVIDNVSIFFDSGELHTRWSVYIFEKRKLNL